MERLQGADATFLYTETRRAPFEIAACLIMEPGGVVSDQQRLAVLRERTAAKLHLAPLLRKKLKHVPLDLHHPVWVDDEQFDITYHTRQVALPKPGDERQLTTLLSRLLSTPLDHDRPLWETYLIEGLAGGRHAMFMKTHHALVDGVAGFQVVTTMVDLTEAGDPLPEPQPWHPEPSPGPLGMVLAAGLDLAKDPLGSARAVANLVTGMVSASNEGARTRSEVLGASMAPPSPFNVHLNGARNLRLISFDLAEVTRIKDAAGVKVNDVALAMVGGAIRRYLERRDALGPESLVTYMPISMASEDDHSGNSTTVIATELRTDEPDAAARLTRIGADTRAAKERALHAPPPLILDLAQLTGPAIGASLERLAVAARITERLRLAGNVVVSNVAGIPVPLYSLGSRITHAYPVGPINDGVGLNFTLLSYEGQLEFTMLADVAAVPDPDDLIDDLRAEWEALCAAFPKPRQRTSRPVKMTPTKKAPAKKLPAKTAGTKNVAAKKAPAKRPVRKSAS